MDFRRFLAAMSAASLLFLSACGGGGGGSGGSGSAQSPSPPPPQGQAPDTYNASGGFAEKGPLIKGSTVTLQELDANLSPTGKQYSYQVFSDLGTFIPTSAFTSRYLGIIATGYYFDEVQGVVSSGPVTLTGYSDLSASSTINVNVLTTLAAQRIKKLIADNQMTFAAARTQAEREVLSALGMPPGSYEPFGTLALRGNSDGDHILAAVSSVFVNGNQAGQMSELISNFQSDLSSSGKLTNQATIAKLAAAAKTLNSAAVAANLNQRFSALGTVFTAADISAWIDQNGDGIVGKFEFQVADASAASSFTVPADVVNRIAGQAVSASAGQLTINGTPVTTAVIVNKGDVLVVAPGAGPFPDGERVVYLISGTTKLARVTFVSGLVSIAITPATNSLPKGLTQQFAATGTFSDGRSLDLTSSVSWNSSVPAVATIGSSGLVQTFAIGSTTIGATSGSIAGSAQLNVTAAVPTTFAVSPSPLRAGVGVSLKPTVMATYSDGTTVDATSLASWASAAPSVATVDSHSGLINGVTLGSTTISVTVGAVSAVLPLAIVTNEWSASGNLNDARGPHPAVLLPSGAVFVAGGVSNPGPSLANAELFDPLTRMWTRAASMRSVRLGHTVTLLVNGKVLVAGGSDFITPMKEVELYDPLTNSWTRGPDMSVARMFHTATLLADGKVLIAAGFAGSGTSLASAELYDPVSNTWSPAGSIATARDRHTATLLANGDVLVTGGLVNGSVVTATAELYNSVTNTWSTVANLTSARFFHAATLLPNGKILVTGGASANSHPTALGSEIYDPVSNSWSQTGSMVQTRYDHSATLLPSGKILVVGGVGYDGQGVPSLLTSVEIYDPASDVWSAAPSLPVARWLHSATLLANGAVLILGGFNDMTLPIASSELYW